MSDFTYNQASGYYEAMDGGHSIRIADDTFMTEFQLLQDNEGLSEAEAREEVFDIGWWYKHLPLAGVFIDGIEQQTMVLSDMKRAIEDGQVTVKLTRQNSEVFVQLLQKTDSYAPLKGPGYDHRRRRTEACRT